MLNKKKPYGEVHGHAPYSFMQDNKFFNAQGLEVTEKGELKEQPHKSDTPNNEIKEQVIQEPVKDARTEVTELVESMTVDAIKKRLDDYEVKYDKKAVKADLVAMLVDEELS